MLSSKIKEFTKRMQDFTEVYNIGEHNEKHSDPGAYKERRECSLESSLAQDDSSTYHSCSASPSRGADGISLESREQIVDSMPERGGIHLPEKCQLLNPANETLDRETRSFSETADKQISTAPLRRVSKSSLLEESPLCDTVGSKDALKTDCVDRINLQQKEVLEVDVSDETNVIENCAKVDSDSSIEFIMEDDSPSRDFKLSPSSNVKVNGEAMSPLTQRDRSSDTARPLPQSDNCCSSSSKSLPTVSHAAPPHRDGRLSKEMNSDSGPHASSEKVGPWPFSQTRRVMSSSRLSSAVRSTDISPPRSTTQAPRSRSSVGSSDKPSSRSSRAHTPLQRPTGRRGELFDLIEDEMTTIREDIILRNLQIESEMVRDPFARLYHMNNRRDRDERRERLQLYKRLEATKERLLAEGDSDDAQRRRQHREALARDRDERFARLSQPSPMRANRQRQSPTLTHTPTRASKPSGTGHTPTRASKPSGTGLTPTRASKPSGTGNTPTRASKPSGAGHTPTRASKPSDTGNTPTRASKPSGSTPTPTRRRWAHPADDATFRRLYAEGLMSMAARAERQRKALEEREQREMAEMLRSRIRARVELESPRCARSPLQRDARVASIEQSLTHDPKKLRAFLTPRQVTKEEEALVAWRLSHHGYVSAQKLAEKKATEELKPCTFHPRTNNSSRSSDRAGSRHSYSRDTFMSTARRNPETSSSPPPSIRRNTSLTQKRACEALYLRSKKQNENRESLIEMAVKQKRLAFLKSKLREDHHFRRRVELDPSLAERFMASLAF